MPIAPLNADRVVADELDAERLDVSWYDGGSTPLTRHFIHAACAGAVASEEGRGIDALVAVLPFHLDVKEIRPTNFSRYDDPTCRHQTTLLGTRKSQAVFLVSCCAFDIANQVLG